MFVGVLVPDILNSLDQVTARNYEREWRGGERMLSPSSPSTHARSGCFSVASARVVKNRRRLLGEICLSYAAKQCHTLPFIAAAYVRLSPWAIMQVFIV